MAINFGDLLDEVVKHRSDQLALSSSAGDTTWVEFDARTNALARGLQSLGAQPDDKVCFLLYNTAEYIELLAACFKARLVHANVNYRYVPAELEYVIEDANATVLVYDERLSDRVEALSEQCKARVKRIVTGQTKGSADAVFEDLIANNSSEFLQIKRAPEDLIFIYTGGTTGRPKGVMWEQADLARALLSGVLGTEDRSKSVDDLIHLLDAPKPFIRPFIASPLMHGTGLTAVLSTFANGGHVIVTDNSGSFDPHHHWRWIETYKADALGIVGDTFAKPLLEALKEKSYKLDSLKVIGSSGVMWSTPVKLEMLKYIPGATLVDSLGSSEAMGLGTSVMTAGGVVETAKFQIGNSCHVLDEEGQEIQAGSGKSGLLARSGPMPLGYFNDPDKTAETFKEINGKRYCIPGDICTVENDGTINLLGRGGACINTGGEKVFPEEIEEALKLHEYVEDALVFGVPDPKWGQSIQAVVQPTGDKPPTQDELRGFLRKHLSAYKIPKKIVTTRQSIRLANGKADYKKAKSLVGLS